MSGNKKVRGFWRNSRNVLLAGAMLALLLLCSVFSVSAAVHTKSVPTVSVVEYSFDDGDLVVVSNVLSDGGTTVSIRGVVWSQSENPTIVDASTDNGSGTGKFTSTISDLEDGVTYYVRSYASNSDGTAYSGQLIVTKAKPTISTVAVHGITASSAWSGGNITSDGGSDITAYGICWGTTTDPDVDFSSCTNEGEGIAEFSSKMTDLSAGTTYYVRAYAQTENSVSYGVTYSFVPNDEVSSYMIWHSQDSGKVLWWKLNNEGNQLNNDQGSGWDYVTEDVTLNSNWELSGTTEIGGQDTLIWHNQDSGKIVFWKLNDEKKLIDTEQGSGWDFVAPNITLTTVWRLVDVREIDGEKALYWYNEKNGKAAWWKLTDDCYIKNETKGEGWDFAADEDNFLGSEWNLAGVIDAD